MGNREGLLDEICLSVALDIEKGGEVAMVDAHFCLCGHGGLGVKRHAGPGKLDHAQIVRAIADCDSVFGGEAKAFGDLDQFFDLGFAA